MCGRAPVLAYQNECTRLVLARLRRYLCQYTLFDELTLGGDKTGKLAAEQFLDTQNVFVVRLKESFKICACWGTCTPCVS
jgi:hypothetical protein